MTKARGAIELWQELHRNLRAFIRRRVRNEADVDDLVQRVLLQIVGGLGSLREVERLHAWIYRVARNAIARLGVTCRLAWRYLEPGERRHLVRAAPLLPLAALAYARGARSIDAR